MNQSKLDANTITSVKRGKSHDWFSFTSSFFNQSQCSKVKPKQTRIILEFSPQSEANNTMNQSKREANTCNRRQARKTRASKWRLVLVLLLIGWGSAEVARVFLTNHRVKKRKTRTNANLFRHSIENHSNLGIRLSTTLRSTLIPCTV